MTKSGFTGDDILNLPMSPKDNDARAKTIREYLVKLLLTLWEEEEGFSGKRPFGNSEWNRELAYPLVKHAVISGTCFKDDGYACVEDYSSMDLYKAIVLAIKAL